MAIMPTRYAVLDGSYSSSAGQSKQSTTSQKKSTTTTKKTTTTSNKNTSTKSNTGSKNSSTSNPTVKKNATVTSGAEDGAKKTSTSTSTAKTNTSTKTTSKTSNTAKTTTAQSNTKSNTKSSSGTKTTVSPGTATKSGVAATKTVTSGAEDGAKKTSSKSSNTAQSNTKSNKTSTGEKENTVVKVSSGGNKRSDTIPDIQDISTTTAPSTKNRTIDSGQTGNTQRTAAEAEAARRAAEAQAAAQRAAQEEAARRKAAEEATRRAAEEEARKAALQEAARKAAEEAAALKAAQEEASRKAAASSLTKPSNTISSGAEDGVGRSLLDQKKAEKQAETTVVKQQEETQKNTEKNDNAQIPQKSSTVVSTGRSDVVSQSESKPDPTSLSHPGRENVADIYSPVTKTPEKSAEVLEAEKAAKEKETEKSKYKQLVDRVIDSPAGDVLAGIQNATGQYSVVQRILSPTGSPYSNPLGITYSLMSKNMKVDYQKERTRALYYGLEDKPKELWNGVISTPEQLENINNEFLMKRQELLQLSIYQNVTEAELVGATTGQLAVDMMENMLENMREESKEIREDLRQGDATSLGRKVGEAEVEIAAATAEYYLGEAVYTHAGKALGKVDDVVDVGKTANRVDDAVDDVLEVKGVNESGVTSFGDYSTKIDSKVTVVEKQELPSWLIETYKDGNYRTVVTNEEITVYRSFGYNAEAGGAFATSSPALSRVQTKVDSAILPEWKNTLRYEAEIVIPQGTTINIGRVGEQHTMSGAKLAGDADQILLPQNWDLSWIKNIREVKP